MRAATSYLWGLLLALPLRAQPAPPDTSQAARQAALATLTPPAEPGFSYQADQVHSAGDSIVLEGRANVVHQSAHLEAARIVYWRQREVVEAWAVQDSAGTWSGLPVLKRGSETLQGRHILYDLRDTTGTIQAGRITYDKGFYAGQEIQAKSEKEFLVRRGTYTTCNQEDPHFDFYSPRIKVLVGDLAIARPVYFRVDQRRLFWAPFYVFSLRQDRQSGMLTPGFGRRPLSYGSAQSEWELRNLGYYLAPSEYWDLTLSADLRQRTGWLARARLNHAWRYHWNGEVETRLENRQQGSSSQLEWWTSIRHNQELSPTASLRASGTFQSNKDFGRNNSYDLQERLNRTLRSNLSFSKRWAGGNTFNLSASQTRNLDTQRSEVVLPELSLRTARKALGGGEEREAKGPWYKDWFYEGSGRLRHNTQRGPSQHLDRTSADLSLGLSAQHRPFSWLSFNPALSENWTDADLAREGPQTRGVRSERLDAGLALTQTYYGLFYPRLWRLTALRHVSKPSATLNYQATHADTGAVFGFGGAGTSWKQERQLAFRLDNTFWAKWLTGEEESKVRLAQLSFSTTYALDRKRQPLSPLLSSLNISAGQHLDTRLTLRSNFYDPQNHFSAWPRLQQFEVNSSLRFSGKTPKAEGSDGSRDRESSTGRQISNLGSEGFGFESGLQSDIPRRRQGRQFQLSHYYARSRSNTSTLTRSWLQSALGLNWGRWRCDYSLNYDLRAPGVALLANRRINAELLSLQREFHDWTFTFNVKPSSFSRERAFYFKFQFKDIPQLQFERGDSRR